MRGGTRVAVVSDLWRYPVTSMGGERLRRAFVGPLGIIGDRRLVVQDTDGGTLVAVRNPGMLTFRARCADAERGDGVEVTTPDDERLPWDDPALARVVGRALEHEDDDIVSVLPAAPGLHAESPIALITEQSIAVLSEWAGDDVDRRRLRPNIVVDATDGEPFPEDAWDGRRLRVGDEVQIEIVRATRRSGVLSRDPDTAERDTRAHAALARERRNHLGACCRVVRPGWIAVGDPVVAIA